MAADRDGAPHPIEPDARVLVTGAGGFVGRAVIARLAPRVPVAGLTRQDAPQGLPGTAPVLATGLSSTPDVSSVPRLSWRTADLTAPLAPDLLDGITHVVHLAGLASPPEGADAAALLQATNVDATRRLAEAARAAGVRRFVYMSSLHVHGVRPPRQPVRAESPLVAADAYGASKIAAERALAEIARRGLSVVALRPPLVAGPGAGGNLAKLTALVNRGLPLPFGGIDNRRPMIGSESLAQAVEAALFAPRAAGPYVVADGEGLSTADLVRAIAQGLGRPARLVPIPAGLAELLLRAAGKAGAADRLFGSVAVDPGAAIAELGWRPQPSAEPALVAMAQAWKAARAV